MGIAIDALMARWQHLAAFETRWLQPTGFAFFGLHYVNGISPVTVSERLPAARQDRATTPGRPPWLHGAVSHAHSAPFFRLRRRRLVIRRIWASLGREESRPMGSRMKVIRPS